MILNTKPPIVGSPSPWDRIDLVYTLAPGIVVVSTPGHGGAWLAPDREAGMSELDRTIGHRYAPAPWYEEDCDIAMPVARYAADILAHAAATLTPADFAGRARFVKSCQDAIERDPYYRRAARPAAGRRAADPSGQACPSCGAIQDCREDCAGLAQRFA